MFNNTKAIGLHKLEERMHVCDNYTCVLHACTLIAQPQINKAPSTDNNALVGDNTLTTFTASWTTHNQDLFPSKSIEYLHTSEKA